ncbi:MAG TPA: AAA family ATPase [Vicinamibacterales bacterium]|nr:AAA family ATPase [Vicinamibacterales bacterium]
MHQFVDSWQTPFHLYTIDEVLALPAAQWAIDGVLEVGAFGVLYGSPGGGKSFVALDVALSIASGRKWQGRRVRSGGVVYIVGEGGRGIAKRIKAWLRHYGTSSIDCARFSLRAVQISESDSRDLLLEKIRTAVGLEKPALIVLDTLTTCFVGGDEDRAKDMGQFNEAVNIVRHVTGAAVIVVHHTIKSDNGSGTERGSGALRGAADMMLHVHRKSSAKPPVGPVYLTMTKQKDHEAADEIVLALQPVDVGLDEYGHAITSCVVLPTKEITTAAIRPRALPDGAVVTLRALSTFHGRYAPAGQWERASGCPPTSFNRYRQTLVGEGYVQQVGLGYCLTASGLSMLGLAPEGTTSILPQARFQPASRLVPLLPPLPPPLCKGVAAESGSI